MVSLWLGISVPTAYEFPIIAVHLFMILLTDQTVHVEVDSKGSASFVT